MILLHDIVDVRHGGADEKGEEECKDIVMPGPKVDVDGVENSEKGKAPRDPVDDHTFTSGEELVNDGS